MDSNNFGDCKNCVLFKAVVTVLVDYVHSMGLVML